MYKSKRKLSLLLVCLMCFVIINMNIKSNAIEFDHIRTMTEKQTDSNVISEYELSDDIYIDINSISIEAAVDNSFDAVTATEAVESVEDSLCDNQVTGSITPVDSDVIQSSNDNSTIYYVGESNGDIIMDEGNEVLSSTETDTNLDYYVENWQELEGALSIKVNKQASCVTVYKGDTPIRAMICSAGETTPEGTFYMDNKWDWLSLIESQYGRYCSQISGDYLFHSVPYNSMDIYDLDTEMYNQLGSLCSHGCVRLKVEDAKWIFDNCPSGTEITIYNDNNPGPLGKPGFQQIPSEQSWDPTDIEVQ